MTEDGRKAKIKEGQVRRIDSKYCQQFPEYKNKRKKYQKEYFWKFYKSGIKNKCVSGEKKTREKMKQKFESEIANIPLKDKQTVGR